MICSEVGCDPTRGVDFRGFSQMVDDEEVLNPWGTDSLRRAPIHKGFPLPCFDYNVEIPVETRDHFTFEPLDRWSKSLFWSSFPTGFLQKIYLIFCINGSLSSPNPLESEPGKRWSFDSATFFQCFGLILGPSKKKSLSDWGPVLGEWLILDPWGTDMWPFPCQAGYLEDEELAEILNA